MKKLNFISLVVLAVFFSSAMCEKEVVKEEDLKPVERPTVDGKDDENRPSSEQNTPKDEEQKENEGEQKEEEQPKDEPEIDVEKEMNEKLKVLLQQLTGKWTWTSEEEGEYGYTESFTFYISEEGKFGCENEKSYDSDGGEEIVFVEVHPIQDEVGLGFAATYHPGNMPSYEGEIQRRTYNFIGLKNVQGVLPQFVATVVEEQFGAIPADGEAAEHTNEIIVNNGVFKKVTE